MSEESDRIEIRNTAVERGITCIVEFEKFLICGRRRAFRVARAPSDQTRSISGKK